MALVQTDHIEGITVVRLARPPVNAIDLNLVREAETALAEQAARARPKALILIGEGVAFSAGLDLRAIPSYGAAELREMIVRINRTILELYSAPVPVIAAVNGHAIAGGLCLALACDYRVCTEGACKIGLTETRAGIPYPIGPISVVKAELAPHVARKLVLQARNIGPQQALEWGIVDELQPADRVFERALEVAGDLASAPADGYARIKEQLRGEVSARLRQAIDQNDDPLLKLWFGRSAHRAAADVLAGKAGT